MNLNRFGAIGIFVTSCGFSQTNDSIAIIPPGSGEISGSRITGYENVWKVTRTVEGQDEITLGTWYDTVTIEAKNKDRVLIRKQVARYTNGSVRLHYDRVYYNNLLPIKVRIAVRESVHAPEQIITDINYANNSFSGTRNFDIVGHGPLTELQSQVHFELAAPIYDWHLWGILISALPLNEKYAARFLAHTSANTSTGPFLWITARTTGSQVIQSTRWGEIDCWVVEVDAEVPWTFWISKSKNVPPIQRIKIDESVLHGYVTWWK